MPSLECVLRLDIIKYNWVLAAMAKDKQVQRRAAGSEEEQGDKQYSCSKATASGHIVCSWHSGIADFLCTTVPATVH